MLPQISSIRAIISFDSNCGCGRKKEGHGLCAESLLTLAFAPQGMLTLLSKCIDRMNLYNSAAHFGEVAGEEAGAAWKDILNLLYELLGK